MWTWPMQGLMNMQKLGFDVKHIVAFDYAKFAKLGSKYLHSTFAPDVVAQQEKHSDIVLAQKEAKEYIAKDIHIKRPATWKDIQDYLERGYLVVCNVNSKVLSNESGYTGHFVLVYAVGNDKIQFHNPGLPPKASSTLSKKEFTKAWAYPTKKDCELQAYKLNIEA